MADRERKVTRGMPNNVEAEASVLGAALIDNKAADTVVPMLKAEDFYLAQNRIIFSVMKELQESSKPIDTVSVADALELKGKLDEVGSVAYLSELAEGVPSAANCEYYAAIIRRDSLTRKVIEAGNEIARYGYECDEGSAALDNAEKLIFQIAENNSEKALLKADNALATAMKGIEDVQTGNVPKNVVYTDFPQMDRMTKGLKPGEMVLIAARPSVGKTAFALNIAANACINHSKTVAVFSLEMPAELLVKRMLSYVSGVSLSKMDARGGLGRGDYDRIYAAFKNLLSRNLYIDDYSMNSPSDVLSKCRRLKREVGLDLVIIDYLQLMTVGLSGRRAPESRQVEVSEMSRKMKIYAKELGVPILLLSQMSRSVEQRNDHTPLLSDLRESGSIEQDADIVMFLHNPSKFNPALPENQIKLDIKKNRNGPVGELTLEWDGETTSFKECADAEVVYYADKRKDSKEDSKKNSDEGKPTKHSEAIDTDKDLNASDSAAIETQFVKEEEDDGMLPVSALSSELPFDEAASDSDEFVDDEYVDDDAPLPDDDDVPF